MSWPELKWQPLAGRDGFEFVAFVNPGFICPQDHAKWECEKKSDGNQHGKHGDEWIYAVRNDDFTISLTVMTDDYRGGKMPGWSGKSWNDYPRASDLSLHGPWATYDTTSRECKLTKSGHCYVAWSGGLAADELWDNFSNRRRFEQDDSFWAALAYRFDELRQYAGNERHAVAEPETP